MDWMFSIYMVFLVAVIARYLWLLCAPAARPRPDAADITKASSGL